MKRALKDVILQVLGEHRVMTLATVRPDGWPHANVVTFCNDGFVLYTFVARDSQKYKNVVHDPRVAVAIGTDCRRPLEIKALSISGQATVVDDRTEIDHARALFLDRFPEYRVLPAPNPEGTGMLRVVPEKVSVVDHTRGYGHTDLAVLTEDDFAAIVDSRRRHWVRRAVG